MRVLHRQGWMPLACAAGLLLAVACSDDPAAPPATTPPSDGGSDTSPPPTPAPLGDLLAPTRDTVGLPGLAALVVQHGVVVAEGATGVRKQGDPAPVTVDDAWQLGGAAQMITATLAGAAVRRGKIGWGTTVAEMLPDAQMHADHMQTRLDVLLAQRSGLLAALPADVDQALRSKDAPRASRATAARMLLARPAEVPPGSAYHPTTDAAYVVAAAMIERAMDRAFEDLVREELFSPLGMASCQPVVDDAAPVPWSHARSESDGALRAIPPSEDAPAAAAPARAMRCALRDWAKLAAAHLVAARGEAAPILDKPTFEALQRPLDGFHALGLDVVNRPWTGDLPAFVSASRGDGAKSMALGWIAPRPDVVFVVVTNRSDSEAVRAVDQTVGQLVERFVVQR